MPFTSLFTSPDLATRKQEATAFIASGLPQEGMSPEDFAMNVMLAKLILVNDDSVVEQIATTSTTFVITFPKGNFKIAVFPDGGIGFYTSVSEEEVKELFLDKEDSVVDVASAIVDLGFFNSVSREEVEETFLDGEDSVLDAASANGLQSAIEICKNVASGEFFPKPSAPLTRDEEEFDQNPFAYCLTHHQPQNPNLVALAETLPLDGEIEGLHISSLKTHEDIQFKFKSFTNTNNNLTISVFNNGYIELVDSSGEIINFDEANIKEFLADLEMEHLEMEEDDDTTVSSSGSETSLVSQISFPASTTKTPLVNIFERQLSAYLEEDASTRSFVSQSFVSEEDSAPFEHLRNLKSARNPNDDEDLARLSHVTGIFAASRSTNHPQSNSSSPDAIHTAASSAQLPIASVTLSGSNQNIDDISAAPFATVINSLAPLDVVLLTAQSDNILPPPPASKKSEDLASSSHVTGIVAASRSTNHPQSNSSSPDAIHTAASSAQLPLASVTLSGSNQNIDDISAAPFVTAINAHTVSHAGNAIPPIAVNNPPPPPLASKKSKSELLDILTTHTEDDRDGLNVFRTKLRESLNAVALDIKEVDIAEGELQGKFIRLNRRLGYSIYMSEGVGSLTLYNDAENKKLPLNDQNINMVYKDLGINLAPPPHPVDRESNILQQLRSAGSSSSIVVQQDLGVMAPSSSNISVDQTPSHLKPPIPITHLKATAPDHSQDDLSADSALEQAKRSKVTFNVLQSGDFDSDARFIENLLTEGEHLEPLSGSDFDSGRQNYRSKQSGAGFGTEREQFSFGAAGANFLRPHLGKFTQSRTLRSQSLESDDSSDAAFAFGGLTASAAGGGVWGTSVPWNAGGRSNAVFEMEEGVFSFGAIGADFPQSSRAKFTRSRTGRSQGFENSLVPDPSAAAFGLTPSAAGAPIRVKNRRTTDSFTEDSTVVILSEDEIISGKAKPSPSFEALLSTNVSSNITTILTPVKVSKSIKEKDSLDGEWKSEDRANNRKVLGNYKNNNEVDETLYKIIIAVASKLGDLPDKADSTLPDKLEAAIKAIALAKQEGGIANKKIDLFRNLSPEQNAWNKLFSKNFQEQCKKCGILSGRDDSTVGLRTAYVPENIILSFNFSDRINLQTIEQDLSERNHQALEKLRTASQISRN